MKRALIALGIEFVLLCILYNFLLTEFLPEHKSLAAAGIISFVMLLPAAMLNGVFHNIREMSLLRRREDSTQLEDGKRVALTGYVRPVQETLISPFTKKPCVSYSYEVSHTVSQRKDRAQRIDFRGHVQVPSILRTNLMEVRLLGLMNGEAETFDEEDVDVCKNAYEYLSSRQFKPKETLSKALSGVMKELTDNDGSMLDESKVSDDPLDLTGRNLEEWCLETNQPYSIIGVWSSAQNGLINDPLGKGVITVLKGTTADAIKTMRGKIGCLLFLSLIVFALINLFAYLILTD